VGCLDPLPPTGVRKSGRWGRFRRRVIGKGLTLKHDTLENPLAEGKAESDTSNRTMGLPDLLDLPKKRTSVRATKWSLAILAELDADDLREL